jgi:hypothetical protein
MVESIEKKLYLRGSVDVKNYPDECGIEIWTGHTMQLLKNLKDSSFRNEFKSLLKEILDDNKIEL